MSRIRRTRASRRSQSPGRPTPRPPSQKTKIQQGRKPACSQIKIRSNTNPFCESISTEDDDSRKTYRNCHPVCEDASPGVPLICRLAATVGWCAGATRDKVVESDNFPLAKRQPLIKCRFTLIRC